VDEKGTKIKLQYLNGEKDNSIFAEIFHAGYNTINLHADTIGNLFGQLTLQPY
jgi:hypothetical protein